MVLNVLNEIALTSLIGNSLFLTKKVVNKYLISSSLSIAYFLYLILSKQLLLSFIGWFD